MDAQGVGVQRGGCATDGGVQLPHFPFQNDCSRPFRRRFA
jgi:hypothetical protein